ncbi:TPA: phage tail protein [Bacillus cereus]|uniref:phage tail spike protein n=1 Tax=Bacillus cereus TaxID=1396 RepID=UPI00217F91E0|nr:phage tail spike protein [Bacillus cereus]UWJ16148.1 prophage LambdaBa01, minor structural protein [Bacillus cereus]HDR8146638.1 phage tail protein [Bacillus cereus]
MRTPSGILHVVDFKTSQIVSNIQPKDYWDDKRHWEIKNNIDTLEFKVFDNTDHAATLMQQNLVLKEVRDGRIVPYVITEAEKDSDDRSVIAYASGEWIQLAKAGIINPQKIVGKTVNEFIDIALVGTKWKRGKTEYAGFHTMTIDEFIDPLKFLKDIASLFELEIQYHAEVVGSQIVGRYVDMVKKRGRDTGKEVTLGKDLMGIKRIENSQNICTALLGFVKKEGGDFITISSINNGVPYLVDNDAFQRWNERGQHKFGFYTPETEQDITPQRLMTLMKTEIKKRVNTSVSYEVNAQSIGRVFGLAHELINEGDTIRIKDTGFTPKLYLEARAIAGDESFTDPSQDKYVFGDYREITDPNEEMRKLYNRVLASLGNKANKELLEQLEKLAEEAKGTAEQAQKESESAKKLAEKVQENLKNNTVNIIEAKNPPTDNLIVGKTLWRDISNGKPGILKVWNGKDWEFLIPDVEAIKKDTLEQVTKEINASAEKLDARVKESETKADNLQKDFNAVKGEQERVSQVTKTLEESEKRTKETIKSLQGTQESMSRTIVETSKGVEGLKNNVSDIKKDQSGITDRVVKTEQNINGISSSIEQINKTSSQTIQKLNQVEQDANGTKQTIERVEKTVNALDTDVVNLVRGTKMLTFKDELEVRGGLFKNGDTFNGNIVVDIPGSWHGIAIRLKKLYEQGKIKVGDFVTYSVFTRIKGAPNGVVMKQSMYDGFGAWEVTSATNQWKQVGNTIQLKDNHVGKDSLFRIEAWEVSGGEKGYVYQQTSPMLSISKKLYPWRPAPEDQADSGEFIKITTEIIQEAGRTKETMNQVKSRVDNLDVGVSNLVINSSCDNEKPRMFDQPGESQVGGVDDIRYYEKHLAIKCNRHTDAFYQIGGYEKSLHGLEPGKEVTISADINCESVDYHFEMFYATNAEGNNWRAFVGEIYKELKTWKRRSFTFKIPNDTTSIMFRIYFGRVVTSNGTWLNFKNVQIERGNIATGYKRAYQDQVTSDEFTKKTTDIEKSVDGIKETVTKVENNQNGFENRVTIVEKTAEGITQSVKSLQNTQTDQGRQLQEAKAGWENTAKALEGKVEIKQVEDYIGGFQIPELKNTVTKNKQDLLDAISKKVATESYNTKVTELERLISVNAKGISLAAVKTEIYTRTESDNRYADKAYVERQAARIDLTEKAIVSTVQKGDIISSINQTAEKITINVSKLAINADTMVQWLTAKGIDTNIIKVNGDKITIDKNGVTIKMLDFLFEDEWGTKTTVMPKRNLIADHDFSSVPKLNIGNPNYQGFGAGYGLPWKVQGNGVVIENNTFVFNYEQMVNAVRVDTYNYPETKVQNGIHPGNSYTLSAHYRTAQINGVRTTAKPRLQVCFVTPLDEVSYKIWHEIYKDFPEPSTFYGEIRRYNFTFTVPNNYNPQEHMIVVKITAANAQVSAGRAVCVSGITLVSGNYACMYNWDRAAAERADGLQPFNRIAIGSVNNNIGPAAHGQTFDISTEKDVFINQPILTQGINLGRNKMGQAGSIRFFDGGQGYGFYFMGMGGQWYKLPNV